MRPGFFKKDTVWTWDIRLSNASGAVNADSNPTITVYKGGVATGEFVTVTKPAATTGWYQCSFNPAGEEELDVYGFAENVTISGVAQPPFHWHAVVVLAERGTDSAALASGVNVTQWRGSTPNALISGRVDGTVGAYQSGLAPPTTAQIEAALLNEGDGQALVAAIIARIESDLDGADLSVAAIATAVRDAILNRVLSGNHDTAGTPGKLLQDAATATAVTAINNKLGTPAGASVSADIAAVKVDTGNLATRISSTLFSGITRLSHWLGAIAGKTADSTTLTEIQETTAGAGYSNTTDSLEALRDRGDAAWATGTSGLTVDQAAALSRIDAKAALITGGKLQVAGAVTPGGDIRLYLGSDYLVAADSELLRSISDTGGALHARLQAAESIEFGAGRNGVPNLIRGTVTSGYASNVTTLTIEIDGAADIDIAQAIASEDYTYQIRRVTDGGKKVTEVEGKLTLITDYIG